MARSLRCGPSALIVRAEALRAAPGQWARCGQTWCSCPSRAIDGERRCAASIMRQHLRAPHLQRVACRGTRCWRARIRHGKRRGARANAVRSKGDSASSQIQFAFQITSCWSMMSARRAPRGQIAPGPSVVQGPAGLPLGCWPVPTDKTDHQISKNRCLWSPERIVDSLATP